MPTVGRYNRNRPQSIGSPLGTEHCHLADGLGDFSILRADSIDPSPIGIGIQQEAPWFLGLRFTFFTQCLPLGNSIRSRWPRSKLDFWYGFRGEWSSNWILAPNRLVGDYSREAGQHPVT